MSSKQKHYEESVLIHASPQEIFVFADDHQNLSSHMNKSSWMMGGGKMEIKFDEGKGQKTGSRISMRGKVFGIDLFLDEVIVAHASPYRKTWQTVGKINLLVIDQYQLGFIISPKGNMSQCKVFIDYDLPSSAKTRLLGVLFGAMYAKWCVHQMIHDIKEHFN